MKDRDRPREEELFQRALERPDSERDAFVDREAADDPELAARVRRLLAADGSAGELLEEAVDAGLRRFALDAGLRPQRIGKYEVTGTLGEGGFGVVYEGWDPALRRPVAIKTCASRNPEIRRRFPREARIAASLSHPRITTVHDFGTEGGLPYLVQELLPGEDLDRVIERGDPVPTTRRIDWLIQVAEGLEFAHEEGVFHRDVKPSNVRVLPDGSIKILDFGIARLIHEASGFTATGTALGTVGYFAPEQLRDEARVGPPTDVFSFGVLAFELLAGRRPFAGASFSSFSYALLYEEPPRLGDLRPGVGERLDALVQRCLEKDPDARPADFRAIRRQLEAARAELAGAPPPTERAPRSGRWRRWAAAALTVALAAVIASGLSLRDGGDRPSATDAEPGVPMPVAEPPPAPPLGPPPGSPDTSPGQARSDPGPEAAEEPEPDPQAPGPGPDERATADAGAPTSAPESDLRTPPLADADPPPGPPTRPADSADLAESVESAESAPTPAAAAPGGDRTGGARPLLDGPPRSGPEPSPSSSPSTSPITPSEPEETDSGSGAMRLGAWIRQPGPGVVEPVLLEEPRPEYPPRARRRGIEATVELALAVDETGEVIQVTVLEGDGTGLGFEEAAVAAARRARYRPATRDGIPGKIWTELTVRFVLR